MLALGWEMRDLRVACGHKKQHTQSVTFLIYCGGMSSETDLD